MPPNCLALSLFDSETDPEGRSKSFSENPDNPDSVVENYSHFGTDQNVVKYEVEENYFGLWEERFGYFGMDHCNS